MSLDDCYNDWEDITELCKSAIKELSFTVPMIHCSHFSLHDAMSATELMDPKMDQCYGMHDTSINIEDLVKIDFIPNLSDEETEMFFKKLFIYESAYLDGASTLESTHNCIFLWSESWSHLESHHDHPISSMLAFSKSMHISLFYIQNSILSADIYEDEDFQPQSSPKLCGELDDSAIFDCLSAAKSEFSRGPSIGLLLSLRSSLHTFYKETSSWIKTNHDFPSPNDANLQTAQREHIVTTRSVAQELLVKLNEVASTSSDYSLETGPTVAEFAFNPSLGRIMQTNPVRYIKFASFLEAIKSFQVMCQQVLRVCNILENFLDDFPSKLDFDTILHTTVDLSSSKLQLLSRSVYLAALQVYTARMSVLLQRSMVARGIPEKLCNMELVQLQWLPIVSRVASDTLRVLCVHRNRLLVRLDGVLTSWGVIVGEAGIVEQQYRLAVLAEMEATEGVVTGAEESISQWCICWSLLYVTLLMDLHFGLTMEMELLSQSELAHFYWYWDYLCSTRAWALDKLRAQRDETAKAEYLKAVQRYCEQQQAQVTAKKSKKGKAKSSGTAAAVAGAECELEPPAVPSTQLPSAEELFIKARGQLCRGQFRMLVAAEKLGIVRKPTNVWSTWSHKFEQRFRAFQNISNPEMLSLAVYEKTLRDISTGGSEGDAKKEAALIVSNATICFSNSRKYIDFFRTKDSKSGGGTSSSAAAGASAAIVIPIVTTADKAAKESSLTMLKVAVASSVAATRSIKELQSQDHTTASTGPLDRLRLDNSYHCHFPIPNIT